MIEKKEPKADQSDPYFDFLSSEEPGKDGPDEAIQQAGNGLVLNGKAGPLTHSFLGMTVFSHEDRHIASPEGTDGQNRDGNSDHFRKPNRPKNRPEGSLASANHSAPTHQRATRSPTAKRAIREDYDPSESLRIEPDPRPDNEAPTLEP